MNRQIRTPIKVVHVITDLSAGGAQSMLCKLVEHSAGHDVTHQVLTLINGGVNLERLRNAGVEVQELSFSRKAAMLASAGSACELVRAIGRQRPSVVQAWMYHANLAATFGTLMRRKIFLSWGVRHSVVDINEEKGTTRVAIRLGGVLRHFCNAVVYCSHESARQHENLGYPAKKTVVIPNGFDCDLFKPVTGARETLRAELGITPEKIVVGMAARWHPMKDHNNLLQALAILHQKGVPLHLVIVGHGFDNKNTALLADIDRFGLRGQTSHLGLRQYMAHVLAGFDILALPSAWGEGFPNVLGEAMACAVPCVATDVGDSRHIIGDTGKVVEPRNPEELAAALKEIIDLEEGVRRQLGERARRRIEGDFRIASVANRYDQFYLDSARTN